MAASNSPFWFEGHEPGGFAPLGEDLLVDVAIVGGGMVGLHCAWQLREAGLRVALFEARRIGHQATGKSTAKVTSQHGLRYSTLKRNFGEERARLYAELNQKAVAEIASICEHIEGRASFERRDAYVYAETEKRVGELEDEAETARALGLPASVERSATMPFEVAALLRFAGQGQFDPHAYLHGMARLVAGNVAIYEQSRVTEVEQGRPCRLQVNGHSVRAGQVVVATQLPVVGDGMFYTKAFPIAHPVAAAPLPDGVAVDGMFLGVEEPTHSFRTAVRDGRTWLVAAGGEYRTGEPGKQAEMVSDLKTFLRERFGIDEPSHMWTNEDFRAMDGAAFIGPATGGEPNLLVATGFDAWGITQGAVAGEVLAARLLSREHPGAELFDSTRLKPLSGGPTFVAENVKAGAHMVGDRLFGASSIDPADLAAGQAAVVKVEGEELAIRRDPSGTLHVLSAKCTHMGCVVGWNEVDETWDCPCHGSRFEADGTVISGPARSPLQRKHLVGGGEGTA